MSARLRSLPKLFKVPVAGGAATQIGVLPARGNDFAGFDAKSVSAVAMWTHGGGFGAKSPAFILPK